MGSTGFTKVHAGKSSRRLQIGSHLGVAGPCPKGPSINASLYWFGYVTGPPDFGPMHLLYGFCPLASGEQAGFTSEIRFRSP